VGWLVFAADSKKKLWFMSNSKAVCREALIVKFQLEQKLIIKTPLRWHEGKGDNKWEILLFPNAVLKALNGYCGD
jgi:hypothetical protein